MEDKNFKVIDITPIVGIKRNNYFDENIDLIEKAEEVKERLDKMYVFIQEHKGKIDPKLKEYFYVLSEDYINSITKIIECAENLKPR